jgi:hypothetical protein
MAFDVMALQTLVEIDPVSGGAPGRRSHCEWDHRCTIPL